jgi:transaldolase/glucose-6-phosphate isomerase
MAISPIQKVHRLGQSIWYDNIQRKMLVNGELEKMVKAGEIWGVTSNPTIFNNAISKTTDYDDAINTMAWAGLSTPEIFWQLACEDIQRAADIFLPDYHATKGEDGYVSLEVDPHLAHNARKTVENAGNLWRRVNRPNLMIKIPATIEGLKAIRSTIADGININITLIFSLERYTEVMDAYMSGLEDRISRGESIDQIHSVASFFVSRLDIKIDQYLLEKAKSLSPEESKLASSLLGKTAIANSKLAYQVFLKTISSPRFLKLQLKGANIQRPLWASTSTKNPQYRDVIYLEQLIGANSINTVPPQTLIAFKDHGVVELSIEKGIESAKRDLSELEKQNISLRKATDELENEGVKAFAEAFETLFASLESRRINALKQLGPLAESVSKRIGWFGKHKIADRFEHLDASLWTKDEEAQQEIRKRMGWLKAPQIAEKFIPELESFSIECRKAGFTKALILGMGGSSLAPEVYSLVFGNQPELPAQRIEIRILDSTDPEQVKDAEKFATPEKTLFIVSSKSGSTSEITAFLDYFWAKVEKKFGKEAGKHFIAITDPGTSLAILAVERKFRKAFIADPNVGGRYSALTYFGLVPASLIGLDLHQLIGSAIEMMRDCSSEVPDVRNPGFVLGAILGETTKSEKDKLTILADEDIASFGSWLEQLIAESSGKQGKGIVPVDREPSTSLEHYSDDRRFIYLRRTGTKDEFINSLIQDHKPVLVFPVQDLYQLGGEFYRWEIAIAIACAIIGVNAFDQPDVQFNKRITQQKIMEYKEIGKLVEEHPINSFPGYSIFANKNIPVQKIDKVGLMIQSLLGYAKRGDYIAINAYLPRNEMMESDLQTLRKKILETTGCATTLGFGPRFLHSTGQLHKGGANNGLFIEITREPEKDLNIPNEGITFGILQMAQALGDFEALRSRGRRVFRIHLKTAAVPELLDW